MQSEEIMKKQAFIVLSGPSGSGKSTLLKLVLKLYKPDQLKTLISYTTRPPRGKEQNFQDYYYVSREQFFKLVNQNFFVEWASVYGHYYGTAMDQVMEHWKKGIAIIKDCDLQGAQNIKKRFPQTLRIFIQAPSMKDLKDRVSKREENTNQEMNVRIQAAPKEIQQAHHFEHQIINENLPETLKKLKTLIDSYIQIN